MQKKYLPLGEAGKGVKMKKFLLGLFVWYAFIVQLKFE